MCSSSACCFFAAPDPCSAAMAGRHLGHFEPVELPEAYEIPVSSLPRDLRFPQYLVLNSLVIHPDGSVTAQLWFQVPVATLDPDQMDQAHILYLECIVFQAWHRPTGIRPYFLWQPPLIPPEARWFPGGLYH